MTVRPLRAACRALPLAALLLAAACTDRAPTSAAPAPAAPADPAAGFAFVPGPALADPATSLAATASPASQPVGLLWQNTRSGRRVRWTLNADGTYSGIFAELRRAPTNYMIEATADFNADGYPDLVWKNTTTGARSIWLMIGAYWYTTVNLPTLSVNWDVAAAADFNHDGKPDLLLRNHYTGENRIHFMDGTTWTAGEAVLPPQNYNVTVGGVGDFNGDGNPDVVWNYPGEPGQHSVWLMDGATLKSGAALRDTPYYWTISAVGDVNGDGKPDLVWTHTLSGERLIWLMDGVVWHGAYASLPTLPLEWQIASVIPIPITSPLPDATIGGATQDTSSATLNATVHPHGLPAIWWFEYRVTGSTADFETTPARTMDPLATPQAVSETVFRLAPGATYEYRVVMTNAAGTTRSGYGIFTPSAVYPGVATGPATFTSISQAKITGTLDPHGRTVAQWFEYGTAPDLSGAASTPERTRQWTGPQTVSELIPITAGGTYYYRLAARDGSGTVRGAIRSVSATIPSPPSNVAGTFTGTAAPPYSVVLQWQDGAGGGPPDNWSVFRNTAYLASPSSRTVSDGTVKVDSARTYTYQVNACNAFGCSPTVSTQVTTQPLPAPSNLVATPLGGGKVQLTWQDNSTGEAWFLVQVRQVGATNWNSVVTTSPNATSYTISFGLMAGTTYEVRVMASVYSNLNGVFSYSPRNSAPAQTSVLVN
jgi:hypothetical protein